MHLHQFAIRQTHAHHITAVLCTQHDDGLTGRYQLMRFGQATQHGGITGRDDAGIAVVKAGGTQLRGGQTFLSSQVLQLFQRDHFIGLQAFTAR